jgi:hypothetical protein
MAFEQAEADKLALATHGATLREQIEAQYPDADEAVIDRIVKAEVDKEAALLQRQRDEEARQAAATRENQTNAQRAAEAESYQVAIRLQSIADADPVMGMRIPVEDIEFAAIDAVRALYETSLSAGNKEPFENYVRVFVPFFKGLYDAGLEAGESAYIARRTKANEPLVPVVTGNGGGGAEPAPGPATAANGSGFGKRRLNLTEMMSALGGNIYGGDDDGGRQRR